ncbi:tyrosine-protein phosphatase [Agromyces sp. C10]|uniref:tyrosine-protein phosphatase n=1 Tax=Agromyces sp. C10 TaxID=2935077 RepID=UPI0027E011AC|nr:tyrosine-protein phosphatase [Agromyces sp. C10]
MSGGLSGRFGTTRPGRVYRSAHLDGMDGAGRAHLLAAGVRTIIDLRNADEVGAAVDSSFIRRHRPVEDQSNAAFMARWPALDSPGYYSEALERWPELIVAVFADLADADGAVIVHCAAGRDRTGMIAAMLLQLCGIDEEEIIDDYFGAVRAMNDHPLAAGSAGIVDAVNSTEFAVLNDRRERELREFLADLDVAGYLTDNGLDDHSVERVQSRLLRG